MEEKNISKLKEKINNILANLSINTITDDLKIVTFLQELKQREIKNDEVEILEKILNNIEIYLYAKKLMTIII